MPHPSRRSQQQLDLFEPDAPPLPPGVPSWADLPMRTQTAMTDLVARMLIAQAQSNAADPSDPEACDDHA